MKKIYYTTLGIIISLLSTGITYTNALAAFTLSRKKHSQTDFPQNPNNGTWIEGDYSILDVIGLINNYLRFAVGFVCFLFMIINGYKLITAHGDEKQTKAATKGLLGAIVGIVICLLAYIIVNLAVKLFA